MTTSSKIHNFILFTKIIRFKRQLDRKKNINRIINKEIIKLLFKKKKITKMKTFTK